MGRRGHGKGCSRSAKARIAHSRRPITKAAQRPPGASTTGSGVARSRIAKWCSTPPLTLTAGMRGSCFSGVKFVLLTSKLCARVRIFIGKDTSR